MNIWLVRDLEPLPTDPGNPRLMRTGILARMLAREGHCVRWITSSFDHYQKHQRQPREGELEAETNLRITILPARGYRRNIGPARIIHNRAFARAFAEFARKTDERPDIIVTDIPTTETAACAARFAKSHDIPIIISIRDLWPDFFTRMAPPWLRPVARALLHPLDRQARFACANASALVGISHGYLEWGLGKAGRERRACDRIIPLGYAPSPLPDWPQRQSTLARLGVREGAKLVAFVGSWGHTYDLELVLAAARELRARADVQFLIAGFGEQSAVLEPRFAELPNVLTPGWIDAQEIAVVLDRAEIGLLPYRNTAPQGLPNKTLEYLAYGAFQIATIKGELEPFFAETGAGTVLETPAADTLAKEITAKLDDPKTAMTRPERLAEFESKWSAQMVYSRFVDLIVELGTKGFSPPRS